MKILAGILLLISSGVLAYIFRHEDTGFVLWVIYYSIVSFVGAIFLIINEIKPK